MDAEAYDGWRVLSTHARDWMTFKLSVFVLILVQTSLAYG